MDSDLQDWQTALEAAGFDVERSSGVVTGRRDRGPIVDSIAVDDATVLLVVTTRLETSAATEEQLAGSRLSVVGESMQTVSLRWERSQGTPASQALARILERATNRRTEQ